MIFNEPPPTRFDLRFDCIGVPVRVSPFFWVLAAVLHPGGRGRIAATSMVLWVFAVFVSILVHELGHALTAQAFGSPSRITLGPMGGLAHSTGRRDWFADVLVIAAGPGAGAALAVLVALAWTATGHTLTLRFEGSWSLMFGFDPVDAQAHPNAMRFVRSMLWINVFWTLLNLMPVYPLDGGQIVQRLLVRYRPWDGLRLSWQVGLVSAGLVAFVALRYQMHWIALMFGLLAYGCFVQMRGPWSQSRW